MFWLTKIIPRVYIYFAYDIHQPNHTQGNVCWVGMVWHYTGIKSSVTGKHIPPHDIMPMGIDLL